jgi:hypothetical protein
LALAVSIQTPASWTFFENPAPRLISRRTLFVTGSWLFLKKGIFCKRVPVGEAFVSLSDIPPVPAGSSPHVDASAFPPRPGGFVLGSPPPGNISKCGPEQAGATVVRFQDADSSTSTWPLVGIRLGNSEEPSKGS